MNYLLHFDIGYDEVNWQLATFDLKRRKFYEEILRQFKPYNGKIDDARIVFPKGNPMLEKALVQIAKNRGYVYTIAAGPQYTEDEIRNAKYVPMFINGLVVDDDRYGLPLNKKWEIVCNKCYRPNFELIPNPYLIDKKLMKRKQDLYSASINITIMSKNLYEHLKDDIEQWVDTGSVKIIEKGKIIDKTNYLWIKPRFCVGPYVNIKKEKICDTCGSPITIHLEYSKDIFKENMHIIESFKGIDAPIVLAGNWFGGFDKENPCGWHQEVFISGKLHEKMKAMKIKGFIEADYVIHAADEPYEWIPLFAK